MLFVLLAPSLQTRGLALRGLVALLSISRDVNSAFVYRRQGIGSNALRAILGRVATTSARASLVTYASWGGLRHARGQAGLGWRVDRGCAHKASPNTIASLSLKLNHD
jgi:hypothetical protein